MAGQNYPGQKYFPEPTQFGGVATFQQAIVAQAGVTGPGGTVSLPGTVASLTVAGSAVFLGSMDVDGPITLDGTISPLNASGPSTLGGTSTFTGPAVFQRGISAGGSIPSIGTLPVGAGTAASISGTVGFDQAASFTISNANVTPTAGGSMIAVTFGSQLSAAPAAVVVSAANTTTGGTLQIAMGAGALATSGFTIFSSPLGSVSSYLVSFQVIKRQA